MSNNVSLRNSNIFTERGEAIKLNMRKRNGTIKFFKYFIQNYFRKIFIIFLLFLLTRNLNIHFTVTLYYLNRIETCNRIE